MTARTRCIQIGGRDASRRFEETLVRPIVVPIQLLQIVGGHSAPRRASPLRRSDRAIEEVVDHLLVSDGDIALKTLLKEGVM